MALKEDASGDFTSSASREDECTLIRDFACFLSCALCLSENGTFQVIGDSSERLVDLMLHSTSSSSASSNSNEDVSSVCSFPSLQILQQKKANDSVHLHPHPPQSSSKPLLEQAAATNLQTPVQLSGDLVKQIPLSMLWNLQNSFLYLVDSRLRSTWNALARQQQGGSINNETNTKSKLILEVLRPTTSPIVFNTMVTTFRTLTTSTTDPKQHLEMNVNAQQQHRSLDLQVIMDLKVLGDNVVTVQLETTGEIQGWIQNERFAAVQILLDTKVLLRAMMQETRRLVRRAVSLAYQLAACLTQTLPRNAPGGLMNPLHFSVLSQVLLQAQQEQKDIKKEDDCETGPSFLLTSASSSAPLLPKRPIDSTTALEECITMPPPPARLPPKRDLLSSHILPPQPASESPKVQVGQSNNAISSLLTSALQNMTADATKVRKRARTQDDEHEMSSEGTSHSRAQKCARKDDAGSASE